MEPHDASEMPHSMPSCKHLKEDRRHVNLTLKDISLHNQGDTPRGTYAPSQALEYKSSTKVLRREVKSRHDMK